MPQEKLIPVRMSKQNIIGVPQIYRCMQDAFHILIQRIEKDIGEQLARKIAKRNACARCTRKAGDDIRKQLEQMLIFHRPRHSRHQESMIDGGKELPDIALEHPDGPGAIAAQFPNQLLETLHGTMSSFPFAAGIGIIDEALLEDRFDHTVNGMMQHAIPYRGLMDIARLRIRNDKVYVR